MSRFSRHAIHPTPTARTLLLAASCAALLAAGCCKQGEDSGESPVASASAPEAPSAPEPAASEEPAASASATVAVATTTAPPKASARPPTNTTGANAVKACCNAINSEAAKAKPADKGAYQSAAAVCSGLVKSVESGKVSPESAKLTIRAQLQRAKTIPSACR